MKFWILGIFSIFIIFSSPDNTQPEGQNTRVHLKCLHHVYVYTISMIKLPPPASFSKRKKLDFSIHFLAHTGNHMDHWIQELRWRPYNISKFWVFPATLFNLTLLQIHSICRILCIRKDGNKVASMLHRKTNNKLSEHLKINELKT